MGISPKEIHMETLKELQDICNERSKSQGLKRRRLDKKVQKYVKYGRIESSLENVGCLQTL